MIQETTHYALEPAITPAPSPGWLSTTPEQKPASQTSRLARTALALGLGTFIAVALVGLAMLLMSQELLDLHDLPVVASWVLPFPTLLTFVLAFLAKRRIKASGGSLTGRRLVLASHWLAGVSGVALIWIAILLHSGEAPMCGGG